MRYDTKVFPLSSFGFSGSPKQCINNVLAKNRKQSITHLKIEQN